MKRLQNGFFFVQMILIICMTFTNCNNPTGKDNLLSPDGDDGGLSLPEGFHAIAVTEGIGPARHLVVNTNGDVYVALSQLVDGKGIAALRDTNRDGKADIINYFGDFPGTGIDIHKGFLYFGSDTAIIRFRLNAGDLVPDSKYEVIVQGFVLTYQHSSKPFTFDNSGHIYVTVGAPSNACQDPDRVEKVPGQDPCPLLERFGGIWQFNDEQPGQTQLVNGKRYATGLRNCVALDWNRKTDCLYAVQHGRDDLNRLFPDIFTEDQSVNLPAEEFVEITEGSDFGWPYCFYDPFQNKKVLAPEYGGDGKMIGRCETKKDPIMAFPAHTAPNDLLFYTGSMFPSKYRNGAFINFHGSWNRSPQKQEGFYTVFVPFLNNASTGSWEVFANGFSGLTAVMSPGDALHRPMGLAIGPDGSLYISDSVKGKIWRILYYDK
jgi:glucose/arabinose dehydrogenase